MALSEISPATTVTRSVAFTTRGAGRTIVWLRGEHDASTVPAVSDALARAIELGDDDLVLDLNGVEFMGAATIGLVVGARALLAERSRRLSLRAPPPVVRRLLELCELDDLLDARSAGPRSSPAVSRIDTLTVASGRTGDLQQRARRGDSTLLSLHRLGDHPPGTHPSLVARAVARLRFARPSRGTRFSRPG